MICNHRRVFYIGKSVRDENDKLVDVGQCLDCGEVSVPLGDLLIEDKYTWYVNLTAYVNGIAEERKIYVKNVGLLASDREQHI